MPFELKTSAEGTKLMLAGRLGVRQARALWDAVQPAVAAGETIRLQTEELEDMDTSIVQILCRLSRVGQLQIGGVSDGFLVSLQRRGLEQFFMQAAPPVEKKVQVPRPKPSGKIKTAAASRSPRLQHA